MTLGLGFHAASWLNLLGVTETKFSVAPVRQMVEESGRLQPDSQGVQYSISVQKVSRMSDLRGVKSHVKVLTRT